MPLRKAQKFQRLPGFFAPIFSSVTKRCQLPCQANSMDLYLYPRLFEPLFRGFFGKAARSCSRQNVEFEQAFLLVLLDRHSKCMCHCVDTGKAQNTLSYLQSVAPFLSAKKALDLVRQNQQSSAHNFVKDYSSLFPKSSCRSPLKKGADSKKILEYGKSRGSNPV